MGQASRSKGIVMNNAVNTFLTCVIILSLVAAISFGLLFSSGFFEEDVEVVNDKVTFETILVNEDGQAVPATFTVNTNDVIYFIVSDRWMIQTPRRN